LPSVTRKHMSTREEPGATAAAAVVVAAAAGSATPYAKRH
jgi:hypothetical protein